MTALWAAGAAALAAAALVWFRRRFQRFRTAALAYLRQAHPDLTVVRLTPIGLEGRLGGVPIRLDLASLFRAARGRPDPALLDRTVDAVRAALPPPEPPPLDRVRGRILPVLKPAAFAALFRRYPPPSHLVIRPYAEGLVVAYVILGFQHLTFVTEGMRAAWGLPWEDLHGAAVRNLRGHTEHLLAEIGGPRPAYVDLDGFEAARILVPELVTPAGMADPLFGVPDEHVLLVGDAGDAGRLSREVQAAHARARAPLSPALFRVGDAPLFPQVVS